MSATPTATDSPAERRRVSRAGRWLIAVALVIAVGFIVLSVYGFWAYANADHLGIIDDPDVYDSATAACARMSQAVNKVPVPSSGASAEEVASAVRAQNEALEGLTVQVRSLGQDKLANDDPAIQWLADWDTLIRLREDYAADVLAGRPAEFAVPTFDGRPITKRMAEAGVDCPIPTVVTSLPPAP